LAFGLGSILGFAIFYGDKQMAKLVPRIVVDTGDRPSYYKLTIKPPSEAVDAWIQIQSATPTTGQASPWTQEWHKQITEAAEKIKTKVPLSYWLFLVDGDHYFDWSMMLRNFGYSICVLVNLVDFANASLKDIEYFERLCNEMKSNPTYAPFGSCFSSILCNTTLPTNNNTSEIIVLKNDDGNHIDAMINRYKKPGSEAPLVIETSRYRVTVERCINASK